MRRRGITIWELIAACFLLAVLTTVCLQFLRGVVERQRQASQRMTAIQEAENLLERLSARPWSELTPQAASQPKLSLQAASALRDAEAEVRIDEPGASPSAKRISVVIRWRNRDGQACAPVRLVTWKFRT